MPTLSSMHIPTPKSWDEFEEITTSSLKIKWNSPNLTRNGRQGQSQDGVDIFGEDECGRPVGVQCKLTTKSISIGIIDREIKNAEGFKPELSSLYIATTAPRDAKIQREVRLISLERVDNGRFPVGILFWDDLTQELIKDESEFSKHYPQFSLKRSNIPTPKISGSPNKGTNKELDEFVERFKSIFINHGVEIPQIPKFLGPKYGIELSDLANNQLLLSKLTEKVLSGVCELFGVSREWLDGEKVPIYQDHDFYKRLNKFTDFLLDICKRHSEVKIYALKPKKKKLPQLKYGDPIAIIIRGSIGEISDRTIYRDYVTTDTWFWSEQRTRIELKALALIAWQFNRRIVKGIDVERKTISDVLNLKTFVGPLLNNYPHQTFRLDYYIFTEDESGAADDPKEALMVREYMRKQQWLQYLEDTMGPIQNNMPFRNRTR
ncbi:hypothetical protein [Desulfoluna spongiiphila]|uniref:hypothetical protein n=1 Tax=Desulfoluna spongiiphila TaxID=419481 RepID=UPI00125207FA|nr:hypothetical protein [Desulfoluna spongiiphila]VVS92218.1 hypothetical protein DBB_17860 [Desulfoluna spongiiphila]